MGKYIFDLSMRAKLIKMILDAQAECIIEEIEGREVLPVHQAVRIADRLMENGVTILPEGAIILTRAELDALNEYEKKFKGTDAAEVVRCKDCKYRYVPCRCALWYGTRDGIEYFLERGDDFYCSYGERRENGI